MGLFTVLVALAVTLLVGLSGGEGRGSGRAHPLSARRSPSASHQSGQPTAAARVAAQSIPAPQVPTQAAPPAQTSAAPAHAPAPPAAAPYVQSHPAPTPAPALADELDARGHDLLLAGNYGEAIGLLRKAIAASGENLAACVQPNSDTCLTYAYALYDIGRALRLDGQPAAAVRVLQERLSIDNQRPTVRAELSLASQQVHQ